MKKYLAFVCLGFLLLYLFGSFWGGGRHICHTKCFRPSKENLIPGKDDPNKYKVQFLNDFEVKKAFTNIPWT